MLTHHHLFIRSGQKIEIERKYKVTTNLNITSFKLISLENAHYYSLPAPMILLLLSFSLFFHARKTPSPGENNINVPASISSNCCLSSVRYEPNTWC